MNFKRTSGVLFVWVAGSAGCTAYPTLKPLPIDCTVEAAYDFQTPGVDNFETLQTNGSAPLWTSGDTPTPDLDLSVAVEAIPEGMRCGSTAALVIRSQHNNDWGSLFGYNNFGGPTGRDESMWEGLSFWARAPGNTTKSFTILLDDPNTTCGGSADMNTGVCPTPPGAYCKTYVTPDGGTAQVATPYMDPMTGMVISGTTSAAPPVDACGNGYTTVAVVTSDWHLYTIPFGKFQQAAQPNRVPNAVMTKTGTAPGTTLLTSALMNFTLRIPKEANLELWIDNLGFYRKKGLASGNDGGADAR